MSPTIDTDDHQSSRAEAQRRLIVAPLLIFVVLGGAVTTVWRLYCAEAERTRENEVSLLSDQLARRLEDFVRARLSLLEVVRNERLEGLMRDAESFRKQTEQLQREFGGFHAINWIDADGVIRWVSPEEGNQQAVGRNVFAHPTAGTYLAHARDTLRPTMTMPLDLFQGGRAFTAYLPEEDREGRVVGYVNGVFKIEPIVLECLGEAVLSRYAVDIRDGAESVFRRKLDPDDARQAVSGEPSEVALLDRKWTFVLTRRPSMIDMADTRDLWFLVGGLALSAAIAFAVRMSFVHLDHERRKVEERSELEAQLQRSQKMEAIGQLAGGVAHDFNNLLTVIHGNASVAQESPRLDDETRDAVDQVLSASEQASTLTRRLLSFSRRQVVQVRPLHLNREIEDLRQMLQRLVREDVQLRFELEATRDVVEMDPVQISQIVMNLVVNSVDAMPGGGSVRVTTRDGEPGRSEVVLSVIDTGEGMSQETQARAVDPFFTTKPVGEGTGLGLATVDGEVTRLGGQLAIRSWIGEGTEIDIRLPLTAEEPTSQSSSEPEARPRDSDRCRILLVEDEEGVRRVALLALQAAGHDVVTAEDGEEALALVDAGAEFDVVVTDAVMPRLGGIDLIRALREQREHFGAVILSGYAAELLEVSPDSIGALFLDKPFTFDELNASVDAAFQAAREAGASS